MQQQNLNPKELQRPEKKAKLSHGTSQLITDDADDQTQQSSAIGYGKIPKPGRKITNKSSSVTTGATSSTQKTPQTVVEMNMRGAPNRRKTKNL